MTVDGLARAVRQQLGLGRLLPLGDAADGAWLAESAALPVLYAAVREAPGAAGVRLAALRVGLAEPEPGRGPGAGEGAVAAVPAPATALAPGALRMEAELAAPAGAPLPAVAALVREALLDAADTRLGLRVTAVDLHVAELLTDAERPGGAAGGADEPNGGHSDGGPAPAPPAPVRLPAPADAPHALAVAEAVLAVPGVARLAPAPGPPGGLGGGPPRDAVTVTDAGPGRGRHLSIQLATAPEARALDVARAVRDAARRAAAWDATDTTGPPGPVDAPVTVALLVTAIG